MNKKTKMPDESKSSKDNEMSIESRIVALSLGKINPETEEDKELLKEIRRIENSGRMLDMPIDL